MATIPCPKCGTQDAARIGQSIAGEQLRWYRSTTCSFCGNMEEDGVGFPSGDLRLALLAESAKYAVVAKTTSRSRGLKLLRSVLKLSIAEAMFAMKEFPVVFEGTAIEAEWFVLMAKNKGVVCEIVSGAVTER
jgi:hypothetical protein